MQNALVPSEGKPNVPLFDEDPMPFLLRMLPFVIPSEENHLRDRKTVWADGIAIQRKENKCIRASLSFKCRGIVQCNF